MASHSDLPDEALEGVDSALSADLTAMSSSALREREIGLMWLVDIGRSALVRSGILTRVEADLTRTQQARLEALRRERAGLSVWGGQPTLRIEIPGGGVVADETGCLVRLGGAKRYLVRSAEELEHVRGEIVRLTCAADRAARLEALKAGYEHHVAQACQAIEQRATIGGVR